MAPIMQFLLPFLFGYLFGTLCANTAREKGHPPTRAFFIGFFFGIFAYLYYRFLLKPVQPPPPTPLPRHDTWFYLDATHTQHGPLPFRDLTTAYKEKSITPSTLLWTYGMDEWKHLEEIQDLHKDLQKY